MNAAGTRAPQAAGAGGTRLASAGSRSPRRRRRRPEEEAQAKKAPRGGGGRGGSEWPAVGAPPRWLPAPAPPRPHPAPAPGPPASGWLRRRRWAALLLLGLLAAGAADGCELVPRNFRGRRASAAAASSPAPAAGDSPALMTGEGRRDTAGGRGERGLSRCRIPIGRGPRAPAIRRPWPVRDAQVPSCSVAVPYTRTDAFPFPPTPRFRQSLPRPLASPPALKPGSPEILAELCGACLPRCRRAGGVCRVLG